MKLKNLFLTIALITFAIGFVGTGESIVYDLGLPVGSIFFMLFLVFTVLEKESALLDEQQKEASEQIEKHLRSQEDAISKKTSHKEHCAPVLTTASSH